MRPTTGLIAYSTISPVVDESKTGRESGWLETSRSLAERKRQMKGRKVDRVGGGGWRRQEELKMKLMAEKDGSG